MTRRDFELIANTIRELPETIRLRVALTFAENLRTTNPRFDRDRFMCAAVGPNYSLTRIDSRAVAS